MPRVANTPIAIPAADVPALAPPLKWAGGKRWLSPCLQSLWAPHRGRRLVEPFCGGLAVALALRPARALLNDNNPHVINFYRQLQAGFTTALPMAYDAALYSAHRARFNALIDAGQHEGGEAAALFYYLNRTGFNGLCRFNRRGRFNVPFGSFRTVAYASDFSAYTAAFAGWDFTCGDFASIALGSDDFVYADPPYDGTFAQYSQEGFGWPDQVRLAEWLARHAGPVVASNAATPRIIQLYTDLGFMLQFLPGPRRISCTGDRSPATEILALKAV